MLFFNALVCMSSFAFIKLFKAIYWCVQPITLIPAAEIVKLEAGLKTETSIFIVNNIFKLFGKNACRRDRKLTFVEYQHAAKALRPDLFVTVAGYSEYGLGHIDTALAYGEGGDETRQCENDYSNNIIL